MKEKIDVWFLTIKYWLQGDNWEIAKTYAEILVKGWKK